MIDLKRLPLIFLLLVVWPKLAVTQHADLLIRNGKIINGTGNSWFYGDIAVKGDRILAIGRNIQLSSTDTIDANGLVIAPGFIDVHTHIEDDERLNPTADNFIHDGVTTVITGNCGLSAVSIGDYLDMIDSLKVSVNVAALVGHNDIRESVMGKANRAPTPAELDQMKLLVDSAMRSGAVGFSTGLIYVPGVYAQTNEIIALAKVAAAYGGVYATHMRNESDKINAAIDEALTVGREAGIPVEISHFKIGGQAAAGNAAGILDLVKKARNNGIEVTIDQYPYTASSTSLSSLIPEEFLADGKDSAIARLSNGNIRKAAIKTMINSLTKRGLKHYSYAVVAYYETDTTLNGLSIESINQRRGKKHTMESEAGTIIDMYINGGASMVFHGMWEQDIKTIMKYPYNMFASDASIRVFGKGVPHPRGYGTNARVLAKYVREQKVLSLEEAIRRMTSLPATKFQLNGRGVLLEGMYADIVVFDPNTVTDLSTYAKPHAYSTGFKAVIVNGKPVLEDGKHLGTRSGRALRKTEEIERSAVSGKL
ncbi:MAG TPA: D-aminoacylase [Flavitalea sp.]|nr:D-aminoacylase [Flavitalea sp.]